MTESEFDLNDNIGTVEARQIIEVVTALAKSRAFTHVEAMKIAKVCQDCCDRLERSNDDRE